MRISVGDTVLFVDVEGARLRVEGDRLVERPVVVVLHGGPGFDQGYLRPDLAALAGHAQLVFPDLRAQGRSDPPAGIAERGTPEAVTPTRRLFGGDMSPETVAAFEREVMPYYGGPGHTDVPGRLMRLSPLGTDVAAYFFGKVAPSYDVRPRLADIDTPTLVVTGRHDWVCPPVGSRLLAEGIPGAKLVEIPDAGHFPSPRNRQRSSRR